MSFNCFLQCTINSFISRSQSCGSNRVASQQGFDPRPTCFAVSLLSTLACSQVSASRTTSTETPLFEVCSAKVGPRYCVLHQHFSRGAKHRLRGPLHSDLNVECSATAIRSPRNCSFSEYSVRIPQRTLYDPIGLAFPHWWSLRDGLASLSASLCDLPRQCLNRQFVVAPERDFVVLKLVHEPRCSLCNPRELRSYSRNQRCPCHLVSPFKDDQHKSHLFFRFSLAKEPVIH